jgi:hypothetical protein
VCKSQWHGWQGIDEREQPRETDRGRDGLLALDWESMRERPREMGPKRERPRETVEPEGVRDRLREIAWGEIGPTVMESEWDLPHCGCLEGETGDRLRLGLVCSDERVRLREADTFPVSSGSSYPNEV